MRNGSHYARNVKRRYSFALADHIWRGRARLYESTPEQIQVEEILQEAPEGRLFAGADRVGGRRFGESGAVAAAQLPQPGHALPIGDVRVPVGGGRAVAHQKQLNAGQRRRASVDRPLLPKLERRR